MPSVRYKSILNPVASGCLDLRIVLTIDRAYFDLTGGLERWLYRLVRKHGGRQEGGWSFDLVHLHAKSGSLSPLKHFAYDLRAIVQRQTLPGYQLVITHDPRGAERLNFAPVLIDAFAERLRKRGLVPPSGGNL
jgi:plasmid replication initiation protein